MLDNVSGPPSTSAVVLPQMAGRGRCHSDESQRVPSVAAQVPSNARCLRKRPCCRKDIHLRQTVVDID
jgi:hypothetical protein